jgi:hypothetical protein
MQGIIDDGIAIVATCLIVAAAGALIVVRPWKGRRRHHGKRRSHRPKIDLFETQTAEPVIDPDA